MRTLMDIYTFLDKHRDELDFSYIKRCLSEIDLSDFERDVRELSCALFDTAKVPESCVDLFLYFVSSGTFGNKRQQVENRLKRISQNKEITTRVKLKYLFRRVFPPLSYYKDNYLHLYRLILPIPFLWFYRIIKSIFKKDAISREMMHLKEASQEKDKE